MPFSDLEESLSGMGSRSRGGKTRYFVAVILPLLLTALTVSGSVVGTWQALDRRLVQMEYMLHEQTQRVTEVRDRDLTSLSHRIEALEGMTISNSIRLTKAETELVLFGQKLDKR